MPLRQHRDERYRWPQRRHAGQARPVETVTGDPSIKGSTDALGLTGPGGVLSHLTGDAAVEVEVASGTPAGALLLRTDDAASMKAFFNSC